MKVILGALQHRLVVVDVEEQKLKKSVKIRRMRWRVWKPMEKEIKEKFEGTVLELVDTDSMD